MIKLEMELQRVSVHCETVRLNAKKKRIVHEEELHGAESFWRS
jgi:hypothetical protein